MLIYNDKKYFSSFEAGNCVSNSSFEQRKIVTNIQQDKDE